ncbi:hypothetical protein MKY91_09335 [Alkalicoccobacillus gibsonii]|uniref:Uncharacterized protein n=1 Tax=Alkalicoccobacillus gibsonii TaxID=79881 RepID=A0ABU9VKA1_9BACI
MSDVGDSNIWSVVIGALLGSGGVMLLVNTWIDRKVGNKFDIELSNHESELNKIRDASSFDYQRKIHDFSMYSTRKHEIYGSLFKKVRKAKDKIDELDGIEDRVSKEIDQYQRQDFVDIAESINEDEVRYPMLDEINNGYMTLVLQYEKERLRGSECFKTAEAFDELNTYYSLNELFVSPEVEDLINPTLNCMEKLINCYLKNEEEYISSLKDELSKRITSLKARLKEEISVGDYKNT